MGAMNSEMLERLIDFSNNNPSDDWVIILNTSGGGFWPTESMAKIINDHKETTIIVQGAYSSGLMLLMMVRCKIILSKGCRGMWHYGKWSVDLNDAGKPYYYDDAAIVDNLPIFKRISDKIARKIMTKSEMTRFKNKHDVYFSPKRMTEIFPNADIM